MSGLDKKPNNKHFYLNKLQSYTMQLSPFRCRRQTRCFSVIPEIFHEEYNQTLSDSDRTARCYVSCEVHTDYIEHFLHVKAGRNSLLQRVIAGSWLFKTKTSKASDLTCPQLTTQYTQVNY